MSQFKDQTSKLERYLQTHDGIDMWTALHHPDLRIGNLKGRIWDLREEHGHERILDRWIVTKESKKRVKWYYWNPKVDVKQLNLI